MIGDLFNNPIEVLFWFGALVLSITVHEFAHALAADRLGDPTPRLQGRLTLNPKAHLDPIGTIMILFAHFGWGKPVEFDPYNLINPRKDSAIISVAGPASNLIMAFVGAVLFRLVASTPLIGIGGLTGFNPFVTFLEVFIMLNVTLAVFNLIPIHPLDGFKIVGGILPEEYASQWHELERYGILFLIVLVFPLFGPTAPITNIINPIIRFILSLLVPIIGVI